MILNVFLDFDGVVHPMKEEFHQAMQKMEEYDLAKYGDRYFQEFPEQFRDIDGRRIFWLPYYFQLANRIGNILSKFENRFTEVRLWVHSAWRGLGDQIIGRILEDTNLHKYYRGILPLQYGSQSRLINILGFMEDYCPNEENHTWIALDDLNDLFHHIPEHFVHCDSEIGFDNNCEKQLIRLLSVRSNLLLAKSLA